MRTRSLHPVIVCRRSNRQSLRDALFNIPHQLNFTVLIAENQLKNVQRESAMEIDSLHSDCCNCIRCIL